MQIVELMHKYHHFLLSVLLLAPLAGCYLFSAMDAVLLISALPAPDGERKVDLDGYVIGPTSSDEFQALLSNAIPAVEGKSLINGPAEWTGLTNVKQHAHSVYQSVTVLTDFQMLFLWWHESREKYEILIRLPYSDVHSIELKTPGLGTFIEICHKHTEIPIGDQTILINRITRFSFLKSRMFVSREKTEQAFAILGQKIIPSDELEQSPNPCGGDPESDSEIIGFGQEEFAKRP